MMKLFTLLFLLLVTLGLMFTSLYLTKQINAGNTKIAVGEKQLAEGEEMLVKGKAKLSSGKQQLSQAESGYNTAKKSSYLLTAIVPVAGVFAVASDKIVKNKISQGKQLVAEGDRKVKHGEEQLEAGKRQLHHGQERLKLAKQIRLACVIGTAIFAFLFILFFLWGYSGKFLG